MSPEGRLSSPAARGLLIASMIALSFGVIAAFVAPRLWIARNVPPYLRADRWELSRDGMVARELAERVCGPLPEGAYVDLPAGAEVPTLVGGSAQLQRCFDDKMTPRDEAP